MARPKGRPLLNFSTQTLEPMSQSLSCFKAYDIRGRVPHELNETVAYRIGCAYAAFLRPKQVVVGRDVRLSSQSLAEALIQGLVEGGATVYDLGLSGTEMVYFATSHEGLDGGIMVTASHNPAVYNGMKFVREAARPISSDSGLDAIRQLVETEAFAPHPGAGEAIGLDIMPTYLQFLLTEVARDRLEPLRIVVDPGNGCAGPVIDRLQPHLPFEFVKLHAEPDGNFPNGVPNPSLPENRRVTAELVCSQQADLGVAWDGDFDRCFLFDERGEFVEGYYLVGLLAEVILQKYPGAKVIYDPRLTWNTIERVRAAGGVPIQNRAGHAFIKERMRAEDAVYGGEVSAHYYFRQLAYCDSGMLPWLMVAELVSTSGWTLSELVAECRSRFPCSGELNFEVAEPQAAMAAVVDAYQEASPQLDWTDGVSVEFRDWRFNLRPSNTEPLLRLNVEACGSEAVMRQRTQELSRLIESYASGSP